MCLQMDSDWQHVFYISIFIIHQQEKKGFLKWILMILLPFFIVILLRCGLSFYIYNFIVKITINEQEHIPFNK